MPDDYGSIESGRSYTATQLMRLLRVRDKRTLLDWLARHEIPVMDCPKGELLISGAHVNFAVQEKAECIPRG